MAETLSKHDALRTGDPSPLKLRRGMREWHYFKLLIVVATSVAIEPRWLRMLNMAAKAATTSDALLQ